ncbi:hypothetical protein ABB37_05667 [Leptomonas pyrrhocoris]|uniref:Uncharacterized protein n=1 Tax=Leptomonas pyrrhocoris TaxID=157538 RepID=A0A0N0DUN8_LEPPY|nr:hypothetical protein ABB37_05667 [Leptomonas pyrrhocoris]KPA79164.1 hypothetical protein ABB37_05667 [Leptomonas pyrrhocoris]|eukprot:XP_015657603.1 hypothetical protein ABB37_05667 [Leptomonas pyrrhocoris]
MHPTSSEGVQRSYGGVLLVEVRQDPAEVPWHVLSRHDGCLFRVVMVFLEDFDGVEEVGLTAMTCETAAAAPSSLPEGLKGGRKGGEKRSAGVDVRSPSAAQRERWRYFAVENGYECVFHSSVAAPHADAAALMEVVTPVAGRRGLLETPLHGSNRLYQLLCNTLWPAGVRRNRGETEGSSMDTHQTAPQKPDSACRNAFVVVGNSAHAMESLFEEAAAPDRARTRRQQRFFTRFVRTHAGGDGGGGDTNFTSAKHSASSTSTATTNSPACGPPGTSDGASHAALVLVNKYYAAVVQPQLLQTAFFSVSMQDMLERYWEQHFTVDDSPQRLCADAPAMVLWPPSPSLSSVHAAQQADTSGDALLLDGRSAYPSLESILDALRRRGASEIVVVTPVHAAFYAPRGQRQAPLSLNAYELNVCAERTVEVVDLNALHNAADIVEGAPPTPVLLDEDDVCATRAVDRLAEILHCVQWDRSYPLSSERPNNTRKSPAAGGTQQRDSSSNSCLLLAYGLDAFQEEAWMCDVVHALRSTHGPGTEPIAPLSSDRHYLVAAAPSIATALEAAPPSSANTHVPSCAITLTNAYFTTQVQLHLVGGLWAHFRAVSTADACLSHIAPRPSLRPDWQTSYDGYVVLASLHALHKAASNASSAPRASAATSAELHHVLPVMVQKAMEWWSTQRTSDAARCADESADTPLVAIYVPDVAVSNARGTALVDEYLRAIVKAAHTSDSENGENEEQEEDFFMPIEVILAAETCSNVATTTDAWDDTSVDGLLRIREAFDQQLWPHRAPAPPKSDISDMKAAAVAGGKLSGGAEGVNAENVCVPLPTSAAAPSRGVGSSSYSSSSSVPPARAATRDTMWIAPAVGCTLPPGFLVDPETLRSVALQSVVKTTAPAQSTTHGALTSSRHAATPAEAASPGAIHTASTHDAATLSSTSDGTGTRNIPRPPPPPLPHSVTEEELMAWMEKMKRYGHRLGETQRKEQAATLALALENLL